MNRIWMAVIGVFVCVMIVVLIMIASFIGTMNQEVILRNTITAKQKDNTSEFDNMWKKIQQVSQCTDEQMTRMQEIYQSHASARTGEGGKPSWSWVKESIPNIDTKTYQNLQNIIVGSRDAWTQRQKELVDLKREHDNLIDVFPSSVVCAILDREKIDIMIVTSSKTERSFETGKDDDVDLFKKD